ncbi:hypothetical protein NB694_003286 [Pantoea ananatis]|nr:hypothetical protein [Pantoea ananatis]
MSTVTIRHAIPSDASALTRLYSQPETQAATLHLPYSSPSLWEQKLASPPRAFICSLPVSVSRSLGSLRLRE